MEASADSDVLVKLATAKEKKDLGDQAFKAGEVIKGTQIYLDTFL